MQQASLPILLPSQVAYKPTNETDIFDAKSLELSGSGQWSGCRVTLETSHPISKISEASLSPRPRSTPYSSKTLSLQATDQAYSTKALRRPSKIEIPQQTESFDVQPDLPLVTSSRRRTQSIFLDSEDVLNNTEVSKDDLDNLFEGFEYNIDDLNSPPVRKDELIRFPIAAESKHASSHDLAPSQKQNKDSKDPKFHFQKAQKVHLLPLTTGASNRSSLNEAKHTTNTAASSKQSPLFRKVHEETLSLFKSFSSDSSEQNPLKNEAVQTHSNQFILRTDRSNIPSACRSLESAAGYGRGSELIHQSSTASFFSRVGEFTSHLLKLPSFNEEKAKHSFACQPYPLKKPQTPSFANIVRLHRASTSARHETWEVIDKKTQIPYAVRKSFVKNKASGCILQGILQRELNLLKELHHPCLLKAYDGLNYFGNNQYEMLMDLGPSSKLSNYIARLSPEIFFKITCQLVHLLSYLESKKVVHRNICLENILVDETSFAIKLVGFSAAVSLDNNKRAVSSIYAASRSPEAIKDRKVSLATLWWQLGELLYDLAYTPPSEDSSSQILSQTNTCPLKRAPAYHSIHSEQLADFINSLLEVDESNRLNSESAPNHPYLRGVRWISLFTDHHAR